MVENPDIQLIEPNEVYSKDYFKSYNSDIYTFMYKKACQNEDEAKNRLQDFHQDNLSKNHLHKLILKKGNFVGYIGIFEINTPKPRISVWIKKEFQGQGIAKSILDDTINFLKKDYQNNVILYPFDRKNEASKRLVQKYNSHLSAQYDVLCEDGSTLNIDEYTIRN